MTVDSAYYPEVYEEDDDIEYSFEIESVGAEAFQVFVIDETGIISQLNFYQP